MIEHQYIEKIINYANLLGLIKGYIKAEEIGLLPSKTIIYRIKEEIESFENTKQGDDYDKGE